MPICFILSSVIVDIRLFLRLSEHSCCHAEICFVSLLFYVNSLNIETSHQNTAIRFKKRPSRSGLRLDWFYIHRYCTFSLVYLALEELHKQKSWKSQHGGKSSRRKIEFWDGKGRCQSGRRRRRSRKSLYQLHCLRSRNGGWEQCWQGGRRQKINKNWEIKNQNVSSSWFLRHE